MELHEKLISRLFRFLQLTKKAVACPFYTRTEKSDWSYFNGFLWYIFKLSANVSAFCSLLQFTDCFQEKSNFLQNKKVMSLSKNKKNITFIKICKIVSKFDEIEKHFKIKSKPTYDLAGARLVKIDTYWRRFYSCNSP